MSSMYFHFFVNISPWNREGPFIWTNLISRHSRTLCAQFGWNWPIGSGEDRFFLLNFVHVFSLFLNTPTWKMAGSFHWTRLNHLYLRRCRVPNLKICRVVPEKKMKLKCKTFTTTTTRRLQRQQRRRRTDVPRSWNNHYGQTYFIVFQR